MEETQNVKMETRKLFAWKESPPSNATWCQSDLVEKPERPMISSEESSEFKYEYQLEDLAAQQASQTLWSTGKLSEPIPNGFYSVMPEKRLKELFDVIPSLEELYSLELEGLRPIVVVVNMHKDKKVSMLQQLVVTLVKGLISNPTAVIKKIAGLVCDFYKRPHTEVNNVKNTTDDIYHAFNGHGIQMLGQIKHGSCYSRAILFKVLADTIGLDSRLLVGLPREGVMEWMESHHHMSIIVEFNSMELLVDLLHHPGQLIPCSTKAIFMSHLYVTGESDSAENDSCDSPLEPNSPVHGSSDQVDVEGLSHSEPYEGRSRKSAMAEQVTPISSPEHSLFRGHGRSILGGHRHSFRDYGNDMAASRSAGASPVEARRRRRRSSISMIPEIGDDIVRVVRAMNDSLKQIHHCKDPTSEHNCSHQEEVSIFHINEEDTVSGQNVKAHCLHRRQISCPKAISLPSSPRSCRVPASERTEAEKFVRNTEMISMWSKVLESSTILNKPLLPFQEWNIDYAELTVGSRVGIGFFGEVFRGIWNGTVVAVKVLLEQDLSVENIEDFCNEISILSRLRHPNVILFLGACTKPPQLSLVTEYMDMGSLYYLIHVSGQKKRISWRRRLKMLSDICRGLICIHRLKVVHRDLKSANCLVNKNWTVKICDFGLSRKLTAGSMKDSTSAGTPQWMAPELIRNEPFTEKCDIFSLGVIMWELCTLQRPWEGVSSAQVVCAVANDGLRLEVPEGPFGKLITDCWAEPDQRPTCEDILACLMNWKSMLC